jgi:hypothetical protein
MARQKTEPFQWRKSTGLMHQAMLREYIRWLFPQLGRNYEPPQSVRDFTAAARPRNEGRQPQPYRPGKATGPLMRADLQRFATYVFDAIGQEAERNPFPVTTRSTLVFVPEFKKLHAHILFLLRKKRHAEQRNPA